MPQLRFFAGTAAIGELEINSAEDCDVPRFKDDYSIFRLKLVKIKGLYGDNAEFLPSCGYQHCKCYAIYTH